MHQPLKVAIQGDKASFHEIAAYSYYTQPIELIYCKSFEDVFALLTNGDIHKAFVAVSNSNHGEISDVKRLIEIYNPIFEGKYDLPIQQHIIGLPGADINKVLKIISHPVALSQCSLHIDTHFSNATTLSYHDTSAAVQHIKELADPFAVAIGSEAAAKLHGLEILKKGIQDDTNNTTVFHSLVAK